MYVRRGKAFGVAAALLLVALPGAGVAGEAGDRVSGSGKIQGGDQLIIEAHAGGNGTVGGHLSYRVVGVGTIDADIVCVQANGNVAVVAGPVREATGGFTDRTEIKALVMDNGSPGHTPDVVDVATQVGQDCNVPPPAFGHTVEQGNFVVQDRG